MEILGIICQTSEQFSAIFVQFYEKKRYYKSICHIANESYEVYLFMRTTYVVLALPGPYHLGRGVHRLLTPCSLHIKITTKQIYT